MKGYKIYVALAMILCIVGFANNCIMEEKVIEIVLTDKTCFDMVENHTSANYTTPAVIDYAAEIDAILADNDLSRSDIYSAKVVSASYMVTDFSHTHDWIIGGYIDVERLDISDGPAAIINYSQSLTAAMGSPVIATLETPGVELLNRALADYIAGGFPRLEFEVHNGSVGPSPYTPSPDDPLSFEWQACVVMFVTTWEELDAPDPF
jgi:hypothetical protein